MKQFRTYLSALVVLVAMGVTSLLAAESASAQSYSLHDYPADYTPAAKTLYIDMARAGDPEALYQLGLMHLRGLGASQNENVARSFFKHASAKGHTTARAHLTAMTPVKAQEVKPVPVNTKTDKSQAEQAATTTKQRAQQTAAAKEKRKAERQAAQQAKRKANKEANRQARRLAAAQAKKARQKAKAAIALKTDSEQVATTSISPAPQSVAPLEPHQQTGATDLQNIPTRSKSGPINPSKTGKGIVKGMITVLLLLLMFAAMVIMGRRMKSGNTEI